MKLTIEGKPIAKMRARHANRGKFVVTYDPQKDDKETIRWRINLQLQEALASENKEIVMDASNLARSKAYEVELWFYLPTNDSDSEGQKNAKLWGFEMATCKPDYDNLEKFYLDCANGILWQDDRMIVDGHAHKRYGEPARVEITVMSKKELKLHPKAEGIFRIFGPSELKEFLKDANAIALQNKENVDTIEGDDKEAWLTSTACILSEFARKYAQSLQKIRKYDGLTQDLEDLNQCKAILHGGDYYPEYEDLCKANS